MGSECERYLLIGFLNKAEKKGNSLSVSDDSNTEPQAIKQAFIEEVNGWYFISGVSVTSASAFR